MHVSRVALGALIVLSGLVSGATLFEDDFTQGIQNWAPISTGNVTLTHDQGTLLVQNTDNTYLKAVRTDAISPQDFTFSASLTKSGARPSGLLFCLQGVGYDSYFLTVEQKQGLALSNLKTQEVLYLGKSSFVHPTSNRFTVSKKNSTISIFVNGHFVTSLTNSSYSSGKIGFAVGPQSSLRIDDVLVTDQTPANENPDCFKDLFNDGFTLGWSSFQNGFDGFKSESSDGLEIQTSDYDIIYTDGPYGNANVRAILSLTESADDSVLYGLTILRFTRRDSAGITYTSPNGTDFFVNKFGAYGISQNGLRVFPLPIRAPNPVTGSRDTLTVSILNGAYTFRVNGVTLLSDTMPDMGSVASIPVSGTGILIGGAATVKLHEFVVTPDQNFACDVTGIQKPRTPSLSVRFHADRALASMFTAHGRRIHSQSVGASPSQLHHGVVIVRYADGTARRVVRVSP